MNKSGILYVFIAASLAITGCHSSSNENAAAKDQAYCLSDTMLKMIRIDSATISTMNDELKLSGEVNFDENKVVKVYPFSSGQVISVDVSLGDYVKAGQVLATIKSADIAGNYADLAGANSDISIAKRQMENQERLYKNGIGSERDYLEAKENYQKAQSNSGKIKDQIAINGGGRTAANGSYVVTAPRSGYVVSKNINPGNFIRNDNNTELFTIGDIQDVWIWANVYETDISRIKRGYLAKVTTLAYPDKLFNGKVDIINNVLDPVTKVMKVKVVIDNKEALLKPEMFANITIENQEGRKAISIPSGAVISEDGKNYVIQYKQKCDLKIKEVHILKIQGDKTFLTDGMEAGEKLIVGNQILLFRQIQEAGL